MTTRSLTVSREPADQWPFFRHVDSDGIDVLSVIGRRRVDESIPEVAGQIAEIVGAVLRGLDGFTFRLLLLEGEYAFINKLQALMLERHKLWEALEMNGTTVPAGDRTERDISKRPGHYRYFGTISSEGADLVAALELTRLFNAVCVVTYAADALSESWDNEVVERALVISELSRDHRHSLAKGAVAELPRGAFAMWSFGAFDDVEISVNVVAETTLATELETALSYPQPTGYISYSAPQPNGGMQTVDPVGGQTAGRNDPAWHIPLK